MDDAQLLGRINDLAEEEERLYGAAGDGGGLSPAEVSRLEAIRIALDQCYDLLRQRQARRAAGLPDEAAKLRPPVVVEGYEQ